MVVSEYYFPASTICSVHCFFLLVAWTFWHQQLSVNCETNKNKHSHSPLLSKRRCMGHNPRILEASWNIMKWNILKHLETSWNSLKHLETSWNSSAWWKCSGWVNRCRCHHIRRLGFQRTLRLIWRVQTWEDTQRKLNRTSQKCWVYWKTEFFLWKTPISYHIISYHRIFQKDTNNLLIISHLKWLEYPMILLLLIFFDEICLKSQVSLAVAAVQGDCAMIQCWVNR